MPQTLNLQEMILGIQKIAEKIPLTLFILVMSAFLGLLLGFLLALPRIYNLPVLRQIASVYITVMRGTPGLILLYVVYYALPVVMKVFGAKNDISKSTCLIIALTLNSGAFFSEIIRSAIENIPKGQAEAAYTVGMTRTQTLFRILLPQARIKAIPNISNTVLTLFKETALGFYIGLVDVMGQAKILAVNKFMFFEMYLGAAIVYWVICSVMGMGFSYLAKKSSKGVVAHERSYINF